MFVLSFFSQALGQQAESTGEGSFRDIQTWVLLTSSKFSNQVAKMTQIYKGYGIAGASDAAKMAP